MSKECLLIDNSMLRITVNEIKSRLQNTTPNSPEACEEIISALDAILDILIEELGGEQIN